MSKCRDNLTYGGIASVKTNDVTIHIQRYAEVPQDRKYHIYQTRFLYNGSSSSTDLGWPDVRTSAARTTTAAAPMAAAPEGHNLVHHAILYAVVQVRCGGLGQ